MAVAKESFPLEAKYHVDFSSNTGHQITVTIYNPTSVSTSSWMATFKLQEHQSITNLWNGNYKVEEDTIIVKNPSWITGGIIQGGSSATFSMTIFNPKNEAKELIDLEAVANP